MVVIQIQFMVVLNCWMVMFAPSVVLNLNVFIAIL